MKRVRFTDRQIVEALIRAESGVIVLQLCREELGVSSATFYKRHATFGGMVVRWWLELKSWRLSVSLKEIYAEELLKAGIWYYGSVTVYQNISDQYATRALNNLRDLEEGNLKQ